MAGLSRDEPLPLTGERTAPGIPEENYWFQRHVVAYLEARRRVTGLRVLDAGCGEGYGTALLAATAREAVGIDLEHSVIERAADLYPRASFHAGNLVDLPFDDGSFEAVVSLQVIEHIHTPQRFLAECARVLAPGGSLMIATPNRLTFSPNGIRNPFHTFEFAAAELSRAIAKHFGSVEIVGVFHGFRISALERVLRITFPERLIRQPAPEWPRWLRARVAKIQPSDFLIRGERVDESLDLIAFARR